ncbi:MAG TPA: bifunctional enoyl-CoA hydratase/phosphate acetyltransferase [Xanthobacteraceae bacterium]|nr:bifunctional enoyl-CoA hydratase/phosphate acetyltransferase [Xanthobacteraceae bacterium]
MKAMHPNRTFDEIAVGDRAEVSRTLTVNDLLVFAHASGNLNPIHMPSASGAPTMLAEGQKEAIAPSSWVAGLVSCVLGTKLPGPGTLYRSQALTFHDRVHVGETVIAAVRVVAKGDGRAVRFATSVRRSDGMLIAEGESTVIAPAERGYLTEAELPEIVVQRHVAFDRLIGVARTLPALSTAVVCPNDGKALKGALLAAEAGLIVPVLVGPRGATLKAAVEIGADLAAFEIVDADDDHDAAQRAVALVREGHVANLMKGNLHSDVFLGAVVRKESGLRGVRRLSHVFVMDLPGRPRPLLITDAAINIAPTLEMKVEIVQNAIDLARALGIEMPRVGILSAVETVNPAIQSTLDAAVLSKMAERGQIRGGIVDGPLAMDNAIDLGAARTKGIQSLVAGQADVLVVPNLESGNMLAKELTFLAGAEAAGIVMGARVPLILTSRADDEQSRLASAALALLVERWQRTGVGIAPVAVAAGEDRTRARCAAS